MNAVLEPLVGSPKLPDYVQELNSLLASERERRQRFYEEVTEEFKAEFINGEVIMHSPARRSHTLACMNLVNLLKNYVARHGLGEVHTEKSLVCLTRNDYEPDIMFFGLEKAATLTTSQMRFPAPDFVVEVLSESAEQRDRGIKFEDYAANGVAEYWLVDAEARTVEQFRLVEGAFRLHRKVGEEDPLASLAVTGFEIPVQAIFDEETNRQTVLALLGLPRT